MADELQLHFLLDGRPEDAHREWRAEAPPALSEGGFDQVDESFNSITYERRYYDWPQKITFVLSLGFALLFKGFMQSRFKLVARFDAADQGRTRVTITGTAHPRTRRALGELAAQHGGPVGLATGI